MRKKNIKRSKSDALIDKRNTLLRNNVEDNSSQELKDLNANIAVMHISVLKKIIVEMKIVSTTR